MQENGFTPRTGICHRLFTSAERIIQIGAVATNIMQGRTMGEIGSNPTARSANRDPDAIIFAQKDDRHGQMLIRRPACRVECALRCRMIGRRIAE